MTPALALAVVVFVGLAGLVLGIWWALEPGRATRARLGANPLKVAGFDTEILRADVAKRRFLGHLDQLLERAGMTRTAGEVGSVMLGLALIGAVAGAVRIGGLLLPLLVGIIAGCLPLVYLNYRASKRLEVFQKEFPDAIDMMTRAIRAGQALGGAVRLVAEEMPAPIGTEFMRVSEEMRLGLEPAQALGGLERRMPGEDVRFFCTAVAIHRTTGGNLAEVLDRLSEVIRERYKLLSHARVLSTQHRWAAICVGLSPVAFAVIFQVMNPSYFDAFWQSPMAPRLIMAGLILQLVGFFCVWRISKIKV